MSLHSRLLRGTVLSTVLASFTALSQAQEGHLLFFPQFGNGDGFVSDLVVYNPSARTAVSGRVTVLDEDGNPISPATLSAQVHGAQSTVTGPNFVLQPQGSITFSGDSSGSLALGSASLSANGPVSGVVRFRIPDIGIAGVGSAQPAASLITPVRLEGSVDTGVAVRNVHFRPIDLTLTLKDAGGNLVQGGRTVVSDLAPGARIARFVGELFPQLPGEFRGTLCIQASEGKIAGVALELGAAPGDFTTLPVSRLDTPPPDFGDFSGNWRGTTGQGFPISFTVAGDTVTMVEFESSVEGPGCAGSSTTSSGLPARIDENAFTAIISSSFILTIFNRLDGSFTSATSAEGTLSLFESGAFPGFPACTGSAETTWTAVRQ